MDQKPWSGLFSSVRQVSNECHASCTSRLKSQVTVIQKWTKQDGHAVFDDLYWKSFSEWLHSRTCLCFVVINSIQYSECILCWRPNLAQTFVFNPVGGNTHVSHVPRASMVDPSHAEWLWSWPVLTKHSTQHTSSFGAWLSNFDLWNLFCRFIVVDWSISQIIHRCLLSWTGGVSAYNKSTESVFFGYCIQCLEANYLPKGSFHNISMICNMTYPTWHAFMSLRSVSDVRSKLS